MKICIQRDGNNIVTYKDIEDIDDRGEIAHILAELESIKLTLLGLWEFYDDSERD